MDPIQKAKGDLWRTHNVSIGGSTSQIVLLIPANERIPFEVQWWRKKEASIVAVDIDGNFFLRYCDGSILLLKQGSKSLQMIAKSEKEFISMIE